MREYPANPCENISDARVPSEPPLLARRGTSADFWLRIQPLFLALQLPSGTVHISPLKQSCLHRLVPSFAIAPDELGVVAEPSCTVRLHRTVYMAYQTGDSVPVRTEY